MQYREFKVPAIVMGGNWMTKIVVKKIENKYSKILDEGTILWIQVSCYCDGGNWMTKITGEKIELTFLIFSDAIFFTQFPHRNRRILEFAILRLRLTFLRIYPSQSQDPQICDIVSSSNSFETFKFSKLLMRETGWRKSRTKKSKTSVRFLWSQFSSPNHSHTPPSIAIIAGPSMGDKNRTEKSKTSVWFFPPQFCPSAPPLQSYHDRRIRNIESSSNIFGNLLIAISNSKAQQLRWEWRRGGSENQGGKNWKRR